jgi:hypothetical protein
MEYRQSASGCIYRKAPTGNQVLTPHGWVLAVFMLGQGGWALIERMSEPVVVNPDWPA